MGKIIKIDTERMEQPKVQGDLFKNREVLAAMGQDIPEVSVVVVAYDRLDKTRRCIESILEYTEGIDYELILVDSGSQDGTLDHFDKVQCKKKKVIHITKNLGAAFAYSTVDLRELGRFVCIVQNDLIVTSHWMENLLTCVRSDPKIGMVNPVSSNVTNLQDAGLSYDSYEEMQKKAESFNHSDPRKWEDRQRLVTLGTLYRKEVFLAAGWPIGDMGFFHDFFDDDVSFTVRRLGYRTVLAGDTWICHDHDLMHSEGKDPVGFQRSLENGRTNFMRKYRGIDAWEDVCNFYIPYFNMIPCVASENKAAILGVDVRCGTPILDIKNHLRREGMAQAELSAFMQDPKYWMDLESICEGRIVCDREEFLSNAFPADCFDYVVADRPLNRYHEPQRLIDALFNVCKTGGIVICKLKNTFSYQKYIYLLGQWGAYDREFAYDIPIEAAMAALEKQGIVQSVVRIPLDLTEEQCQILDGVVPTGLPEEQRQELLQRMLCKEYLFVVWKSEKIIS